MWVLNRYVPVCLDPVRTSITETLHTQIQKDALQRDIPVPNEACARRHCLYGMDAPDLVTVKRDFTYTSLQAAAEF
jgi:hypothetical protein